MLVMQFFHLIKITVFFLLSFLVYKAFNWEKKKKKKKKWLFCLELSATIPARFLLLTIQFYISEPLLPHPIIGHQLQSFPSYEGVSAATLILFRIRIRMRIRNLYAYSYSYAYLCLCLCLCLYIFKYVFASFQSNPTLILRSICGVIITICNYVDRSMFNLVRCYPLYHFC